MCLLCAANEVVMLANTSKVIIRTKYNTMIVLPLLVLSQSMQPPTYFESSPNPKSSPNSARTAMWVGRWAVCGLLRRYVTLWMSYYPVRNKYCHNHTALFLILQYAFFPMDGSEAPPRYSTTTLQHHHHRGLTWKPQMRWSRWVEIHIATFVLLLMLKSYSYYFEILMPICNLKGTDR